MLIMSALKDVTLEIIGRLPDECSLEDIMYEINFVAQVLEGLEDADAGKLLTTDELLNRVKQWAK
jgi:predicted transcriptional regulator